MENAAISRSAIDRKLAVTGLVLGGVLLFGDANFLFVTLTSGRLLVRQPDSVMHVLLVINPLSPPALIGAVGAISLGIAAWQRQAAKIGVALGATHIAFGVAGLIFIIWLFANAPWAR